MMLMTSKGTPRVKAVVSQPLWAALRSATAPQSIADLLASCPGTYDTVHTALKRWQDRGAVVRHTGKPLRFRLVDGADSLPPDGRSETAKTNMRERSARQRIWAAMRVLKTFDAPTLRMTANATERAVATYLNQLQRARYVQMTERGFRQTGRVSVYRLARNTGPKCPTISRTDGKTFLIDNNNGRRVDTSPGAVSLGRKREAPFADGGVG
ncbi:hypothetical protein [Sphingomonas sp. 1185]|uniref:hypothetical protein n=1 Tax=Sphingomonas sp. 1185 TaxID=3156411 RepID=UPI00339848AE